MDLDEALARVPCLAGARGIEELTGGLTNRNIKVTAPAGVFVVRLSSNDSGLLAVDRNLEYVNSQRAAEAGVGAEVMDYLPGQGVLVVRFLEGRTFSEADVAAEANWPRIAEACRRLHGGPRFDNVFDMFDIQRRYLDVVIDRGFRLPDGYLDLMPTVERLRVALAGTAEPTVPCNNDLLAGNFIDTGSELRLIDYEYSGNNDPCFELGNIWSEAGLPIEALTEMVGLYYGSHSPSRVARARLMGLMSKYGWTLWASIQDGVSPIDFDFWSWGMEKYTRALPEFEAHVFDGLVAEALSDN